jgi:hypothetical protein
LFSSLPNAYIWQVSETCSAGGAGGVDIRWADRGTVSKLYHGGINALTNILQL